MKKNRFDVAYKKWLQQFDIEEDNSIWNEVEDKLDFIETWEKIAGKLNEINTQKGRVFPMLYLKRLLAAAAMLLLVFSPSRHLVRQVNDSTIISELVNKTYKLEFLASDTTTELHKKTLQEGNKVEVIETAQVLQVDSRVFDEYFEEKIPTRYFADSSKIFKREHTEGLVFRYNELPFKGLNNITSIAKSPINKSDDFNLKSSLETDVLNLSESEKSSDLKTSKFAIRIIDVGLIYGYKNTWLLNNETRNGLNPEKLGNVEITFRQDMGFASTMELNNRHKFGLEFFWKSESGQNYQQYLNASYVNKNIYIEYLKLQTFYSWENKFIPGQVLLGGYVARLSKAEEQIAEAKFNTDNRYNDYDYGLLAGYQIEIPLMKRVRFKPSIRFNYNLINIFESDNITLSSFKDTRNLGASFNVLLSYNL